MKILFCAYDRPGHIATGPNAWIQRLIPDLRDRYDLDIHTLFIYNGKISECPTLSFFQAKGLPTLMIDRGKIHYVSDQVKQILQFIKTFDFKILVANLVIPALYSARYLKPYNVSVIGVLHSNDSFYQGVIDKFLKGEKENQLTAVVSVSKYLSSRVNPSGFEFKNVTIPCGTPLNEKKSHKERDEVLKIMYAGRLEIVQKQIIRLTDSFIKAAESNALLTFNIFGSGSAERDIVSMINGSKVSKQVRYGGSVLPSEIQEIMSQHHVFTLMSDFEGMPIALMEAMSCGLVPVCLNEESGINEIVEHGINGFIVQNTQEDYQKHIGKLLNDNDLWREMSKNAVKTIELNYSTDITHTEWAKFLLSFGSIESKPIEIPKEVRLQGDLLYYGDNRKPSRTQILKTELKNFWIKVRLAIRPRARLRSLFRK